MELQEVEILASDPLFHKYPTEEELLDGDPLFWVKQYRIKYKFDTYESEEDLVEEAVREAMEDFDDLDIQKDNRPFFMKSRPTSTVEIDADQTRYLFGKVWNPGNGWSHKEISGFCVLHKKDKTVLLEFIKTDSFWGHTDSPYWN